MLFIDSLLLLGKAMLAYVLLTFINEKGKTKTTLMQTERTRFTTMSQCPLTQNSTFLYKPNTAATIHVSVRPVGWQLAELASFLWFGAVSTFQIRVNSKIFHDVETLFTCLPILLVIQIWSGG